MTACRVEQPLKEFAVTEWKVVGASTGLWKTGKHISRLLGPFQ